MDKITFRKELEYLINRYSMENGSQTPDFILADYLVGCLEAFNTAVNDRGRWYGSTPVVDTTVIDPIDKYEVL